MGVVYVMMVLNSIVEVLGMEMSFVYSVFLVSDFVMFRVYLCCCNFVSVGVVLVMIFVVSCGFVL